jgi:hypothetical protein
MLLIISMTGEIETKLSLNGTPIGRHGSRTRSREPIGPITKHTTEAVSASKVLGKVSI